MEPEPVTKGWKTSEFWLALFPQLLALGVVLHVINAEDVDSLQQALVRIVESLGSIVLAASALWKYLQSRTEVKTAKDKAVVAVAEEKKSDNLLTVAERKKHS